MHPLIRDKRAEILRIAKANGATRVRIFGSSAHGTARPDSDVDLLVNLEPGGDLFDIVAMGQHLSDLLGRPVHVVTENAISPYIRDEIIHGASPPMSRDSFYLRHILDAIARIEEYVADGRERFLAETVRQDGVVWQLELIGEATKHLSPELRDRHPEAVWRGMTGSRDRRVHGYMEVDLDVVWRVTQQSLPDLKPRIEAILEEEVHG
jgi:uncharacterized protein with HEPN domain/predicted nucleotidyltransferase